METRKIFLIVGRLDVAWIMSGPTVCDIASDVDVGDSKHFLTVQILWP